MHDDSNAVLKDTFNKVICNPGKTSWFDILMGLWNEASDSRSPSITRLNYQTMHRRRKQFHFGGAELVGCHKQL